jgi:hypothetical protein
VSVMCVVEVMKMYWKDIVGCGGTSVMGGVRCRCGMVGTKWYNWNVRYGKSWYKYPFMHLFSVSIFLNTACLQARRQGYTCEKH